MEMVFSFLPKLGIVLVDDDWQAEDGNNPPNVDILGELYPGDHGLESPNPTNLFLLDALRLADLSGTRMFDHVSDHVFEVAHCK